MHDFSKYFSLAQGLTVAHFCLGLWAMDNKRLGAWIREKRAASGMTQLALAHALSTDPGSISRWERGEVSPHLEQLRKLCALLGASADEALDLTAPPADPSTGEHAR